MTPRDQKLALLLIVVMALTVGAVGGYLFVLQPVQKNLADKDNLQAEIAELEGKQQQLRERQKRLTQQRAQSLPADLTLAKQEYFVALEQLVGAAIKAAEDAGVPRGEVKTAITAKVIDNSARGGVPEISKGRPMYTKIAYEVTIKKADMWVVRDVLKGYYDLDLLHQITAFSLKKDDDNNTKGPVKRNDLTLVFTTEALVVDGAQNRRTLIAVPTAFGAAGGAALLQLLERSTETGRGASARPAQPVLATKARDYSLLALKDPFNGPLPPPASFKLSPIKDVTVKQDDAKATTVAVKVSGEGATGAKLRAVASGTLFPEGELKVDNKWLTVELPKTSLDEGTAKVDVFATSADGKTVQTSFKVAVEPKKEVVDTTPPKIKDDVSGAIILTMVTYRTDGTASAAIRDGASRQRYEIEVEGKKVTVGKYYYIKDKKKEDEIDKNGIINISDDNSGTKRTFKVIAVDAEGLIVEDQKPAGAAKKDEAPKPKGGPGGGWPPKGGPGGWPPRQGPASPVAALGGNVAAGVLTPAPAAPKPKLYRWTVGQSLLTVDKEGELTEDEAKKVLKQAADNGPMLDLAATGR